MTNVIEKVKQAAAQAQFHETEAKRYNKILADLLHGMGKKEVIDHSTVQTKPKITRKRQPMQLDSAKRNVLAVIGMAKRPLSVSEIEDEVPHSLTTTKRALKSLHLANQIKQERMLGRNKKPYQGWSVA